MDAMTTELHRAFTSLGKAVAETARQAVAAVLPQLRGQRRSVVSIRAQYGALVDSSANHVRVADVQVRLGSPSSTTRTARIAPSAVNSMQLPLTDAARR